MNGFDARTVACRYLDRGWAPIPIPRGAKKPIAPAWGTLEISRQNVALHFVAESNIGVVLGPRSGGLADIDLDCAEAIALAPHILPPTGAIFGRSSKQQSHWLYRVLDPDSVAAITWKDPERESGRGNNGADRSESDKAMLVELRLGGGGKQAQTVFPGSTHLSGESIVWDHEGEPASCSCAILKEACVKLAVACLLVRYWPRGGGRHDAALSLGGFLARCGWSGDEIARFVEPVAQVAGDEETADRVKAAASAADKLAKGEQVAGLPKLAEVFGEAVATKIAEWLHYRQGPSAKSEEKAERKSQANILIELAAVAKLFHTPDSAGYADLDINGHRETWPIRSKGFRRWLARRFFEETGGASGSEALQSALNVIEAKAHFDAPEHVAHIRVGGLDGRLYLDLCDETWRAVEIDATGWRVIDRPPVRFRRAAGMQALPIPRPGGSIETLRSFLNVQSDSDFVLVVAWALAVLRNRGPYPVLALSGEQGSAKSTFSAILRALLDPNTAPLRALPREVRDLFIAATNGHVLAFDNVSGLPAWISDTLCRLATGGGFAARQLYTDQDEVLFDAARPVILNGIEDIVTRPDLADRAVFLTLEPIPEDRRRPEAEIWAEFEVATPYILGALLDAVVEGLRRWHETRLEKLPRMADFALWAVACETALWPAGTFWSAYCGNRDEAVEGVIDADPIAAAMCTMMSKWTEWMGTAADLLGALGEAAGERVVKSKTWPDSPRALAGRLRRAAPVLRKVGVEISFEREHRARRARLIKITTIAATQPESGGAQPSTSPTSSTSLSKPTKTNGSAAPSRWTIEENVDGSSGGFTPTVHSTNGASPLKVNEVARVDGMDGKIPTASAPHWKGISGRILCGMDELLREWKLKDGTDEDQA